MSRFLKSIHRNELNLKLKSAYKVLEQSKLTLTQNELIESSVRESFSAISQMISQPVTERDR